MANRKCSAEGKIHDISTVLDSLDLHYGKYMNDAGFGLVHLRDMVHAEACRAGTVPIISKSGTRILPV